MKQFDHVVTLCGLSLHTLPGWGASPQCAPVCHGAVAMFKTLSCFGAFDRMAASRGGALMAIT